MAQLAPRAHPRSFADLSLAGLYAPCCRTGLASRCPWYQILQSLTHSRCPQDRNSSCGNIPQRSPLLSFLPGLVVHGSSVSAGFLKVPDLDLGALFFCAYPLPIGHFMEAPNFCCFLYAMNDSWALTLPVICRCACLPERAPPPGHLRVNLNSIQGKASSSPSLLLLTCQAGEGTFNANSFFFLLLCI